MDSRVGLRFLFWSCPFSFHVQYVRKYQNYPMNCTMQWHDWLSSRISAHSSRLLSHLYWYSNTVFHQTDTSVFVFSTRKASPHRSNASYIYLTSLVFVGDSRRLHDGAFAGSRRIFLSLCVVQSFPVKCKRNTILHLILMPDSRFIATE